MQTIFSWLGEHFCPACHMGFSKHQVEMIAQAPETVKEHEVPKTKPMNIFQVWGTHRSCSYLRELNFSFPVSQGLTFSGKGGREQVIYLEMRTGCVGPLSFSFNPFGNLIWMDLKKGGGNSQECLIFSNN